MLREKPEFYKEEVRCGYTVNEKTKRVWAVQLEMLDEVERICKANGLKYFADSGTLIGAIRHEGYIPWDDDIDLVMLREDYDKFVQIAPKWLKEDLVLQTVYTEKNYLRGHAQIRNSKTCGCNEEDKKAGYNCGIFIDIFPLDGMPKTEKERKNWAKKIQFYWTVLYTWYRFDYYENANVLRLSGENLDGSSSSIVFYSARGMERLKDLTGKGADHDPCGTHKPKDQ